MTYKNALGTFSDEYVNGDCLVCGLPRKQCAEKRNMPYTKIEEE